MRLDWYAKMTLALAATWLLLGCSPSAVDPQPEEEIRFLRAVTEAQAQADQTDNGIRLDQLRAERDRRVCDIVAGAVVSGWIGTVTDVDSTMAGDGIVSLSLANEVSVGTWNNVLSDAEDHTIIPKGTPLFDVLGGLSKGEKVIFSGHFVQSSGCPDESSLTTSGSLMSPSYIFNFSSIQPVMADSS